MTTTKLSPRKAVGLPASRTALPPVRRGRLDRPPVDRRLVRARHRPPSPWGWTVRCPSDAPRSGRRRSQPVSVHRRESGGRFAASRRNARCPGVRGAQASARSMAISTARPVSGAPSPTAGPRGLPLDQLHGDESVVRVESRIERERCWGVSRRGPRLLEVGPIRDRRARPRRSGALSRRHLAPAECRGPKTRPRRPCRFARRADIPASKSPIDGGLPWSAAIAPPRYRILLASPRGRGRYSATEGRHAGLAATLLERMVEPAQRDRSSLLLLDANADIRAVTASSWPGTVRSYNALPGRVR